MMKLNLMISQNIASFFVDRFNEGGPVIMSLILICFIFSIVFFVIAFINITKNPAKSVKMRNILEEIGLLSLVIGFFGSILGLISAFDAIGAIGDISTDVFASGLKVSFLSTLFGTFTFIISRLAILFLKVKGSPSS